MCVCFPYSGTSRNQAYKQQYQRLQRNTGTGVGTLEISGGIYNTAGFLQRDSWRKDTNIITSKMQALGSLARSHTRFREGVATPDYNIIRVGGERSFLFNSQRLQFAVYNGRHCIFIDI